MLTEKIRRLMWAAELDGRIKLPTVRTPEQTVELGRTVRDQNGELIVDPILYELSSSIPGARSFAKHSFDPYAIAVTSLTPSVASRESQLRALDSWVQFGFTIVSMNRRSEIDAMESIYPQVDRWMVPPKNGMRQGTSIPLIGSLAGVAVTLEHPIVLINSDIEIYGDQSRLSQSISRNGTLLIGIRFNYVGSDYVGASRELWGLDVFGITPDMAKSLPRSPMCIGRPAWDYWIPCHFRKSGFEFDVIGEPFFFHRMHELRWSKQDWRFGCKWLTRKYGKSVFDWQDSVAFRYSLPYPPS